MPREVCYSQPKSQPAETLLSFLSRKFTYLSRDAWAHHLSEGHVCVDGVAVNSGDYVLRQGGIVRFAPPRSLEPPVDEENIRVLYEDASLLVCAKNGNIPVAEGGRYCENTLIGVLQRRGTRAFYAANTVVVGVGAAESNVSKEPCEAAHINVADAAPLLGKEKALHERQRTETELNSIKYPPPEKRSRELTPPRETTLTAAFPTFLTVQRLDKETSGVLVLCKSSGAAQKVACQLERQTRSCSAAVEARVEASQAAFTNVDFNRILRQCEKTVSKTYTAVLLGAVPIGETFVVVNYMGTMQSSPMYRTDPAHSQLKKLKMCCEPLCSHNRNLRDAEADASPKAQWGKVACTRIRVLTSSQTLGLSCVQLDLLTGRSHQIRVHCASLGYPILGDKLYTCTEPGKANDCVAVPDDVYLGRVRSEDAFVLLENYAAAAGHRMWCRRHLLHATELQFEHPERCPTEVMRFVVSPVDFFARDVRFESPQDAHSFQVLLHEAFDQYDGARRTTAQAPLN